MKKILFSLLALTSLIGVQETLAQRTIPLSINLKEPINNLVVPQGGLFFLSFSITNMSVTESIRSGDTILFTYGSNLEGILMHTSIGPGQTFSFDSLANFSNTNSDPTDVTRPFCIRVLGTANTTNPGSWSNPNFNTQVCAQVTLRGTSSSGCDPTYAALSISSCGVYSSPSGKYSWNTSGTYKDTLTNAAGCDSVISISLHVGQLDKGVTKSVTSLKANSTGLSYQWVDCDNNYQAIAGATQMEFVPTVTGSYAVILKEGTCVDTSICYDFEVEGAPSNISNINASLAVIIYPNPSRGHFTITCPEEGVKEIAILSLSGQVLHKEQTPDNNHPLSLDHLPSGMYLVKVGTSMGYAIHRVVLLP